MHDLGYDYGIGTGIIDNALPEDIGALRSSGDGLYLEGSKATFPHFLPETDMMDEFLADGRSECQSYQILLLRQNGIPSCLI